MQPPPHVGAQRPDRVMSVCVPPVGSRARTRPSVPNVRAPLSRVAPRGVRVRPAGARRTSVHGADGRVRAGAPRRQLETQQVSRSHARPRASSIARSMRSRTRAERRLAARRSSFVETSPDASARPVASITTLGSAPMSATSASVRAGDVTCSPKRVAISSRRNGTLVVCSLAPVPESRVLGRCSLGSVRWISCERVGARS